MKSQAIKHASPVWRSKADFVIRTLLDRSEVVTYEHLWCRWLSGYTFEICCIPFFAYGISLGDKVETDPDANLTKVVERSNRRCVRVWLESGGVDQGDLERVLIKSGFLFEWHSARLASIDFATNHAKEGFEAEVGEWEREGHILLETSDSLMP